MGNARFYCAIIGTVIMTCTLMVLVAAVAVDTYSIMDVKNWGLDTDATNIKKDVYYFKYNKYCIYQDKKVPQTLPTEWCYKYRTDACFKRLFTNCNAGTCPEADWKTPHVNYVAEYPGMKGDFEGWCDDLKHVGRAVAALLLVSLAMSALSTVCGFLFCFGFRQTLTKVTCIVGAVMCMICVLVSAALWVGRAQGYVDDVRDSIWDSRKVPANAALYSNDKNATSHVYSGPSVDLEWAALAASFFAAIILAFMNPRYADDQVPAQKTTVEMA